MINVGAVILPGARIGNGSVIGANAVVRGIVPDYAIVEGNPGAVVKYRFDSTTISRFQAIHWWSWPRDKLLRFMPELASGDPASFLNAVERDLLKPQAYQG